MGLQIEDGSGTGKVLKVDDKQRAYIRQAAYSGENFEALEGDSFILHGESTVTSATTSGSCFFFKNTSKTFNVHITRIYVDSHALTDDFVIRQVFDADRSGGTDIGSNGKVNKNRGSGKILEGDLYLSDASSVMTLTNGVVYHAVPVESLKQYTRDMRGSNVITPNKSIGWTWATTDGAAPVEGEVISFSVNCYRELIP